MVYVMHEPVTKQDLKDAFELQYLRIILIVGIQLAVAFFFILLFLNAYLRT